VVRGGRPIPLDLLLVTWLGFLFGWCARERLKVDGPWAQPAVSLVLLYGGIVVVPASLYFYLVHPAWSWLYLLDGAEVPTRGAFGLAPGRPGIVLAGFYGAGRFGGGGREFHLRLARPASAVILALLVLIVRRRLLHVGTFEQFHDGRAQNLMDVKLGYVLVAVLIGAGASATVVATELLRDGRRASAR